MDDRLKSHLEVELSFTRTEDGGRQQPVRNGYRVIHDFYGDGTFWDGIHTYPDRDEVRPGESVSARITLLVPEAHGGRLYPGLAFRIQEGAKMVARGRIVRVLDQALSRPKGSSPLGQPP